MPGVEQIEKTERTRVRQAFGLTGEGFRAVGSVRK